MVSRFMTGPLIPFSDNDAERPVRVIKVRRKISGCFRALDMAEGFRKMRGHIVSREKNGVSSYKAIKMLFDGKTPGFIKDRIASGEKLAA
jgi:transposase